MFTDIIFSLYIILLFPFLYQCEKLKAGGLKLLLIGVLFTPVIGYISLYFYRKRQSTSKKSLLS